MTRDTVLVVFAHPDDESIACGGTLARLADEGARVVLVCASRGERGATGGLAEPADLGHLRVGEMQAAARALGVSDLLILDHPDGFLPWMRRTEFGADLRRALAAYRPSAVVTFGADGLYWHPDHIATYAATTAAVTNLGRHAPALYYVTMPLGAVRGVVNAALVHGWTPPASGFWSLEPNAFGLHAAPPDVVVDVAAWVPQKLRAIRCHESQMGELDPLSLVTAAEAARWLGTEHFHRATINNGTRASVLERLSTM